MTNLDVQFMSRALELAARGRGAVEPNPMVGCVVVQGDRVVGEGWHPKFGGPHAEVVALHAAGAAAVGATLYVTLEPCCHHGKTPPCTDAVIRAGIHRVVAAMRDPFTAVDGGGLQQLGAAGIHVESGLLEAAARDLNAPYLKLLAEQRPWVIAKWAMSWDGKIATRTGDSRWISSADSRAIVHELRGRMDAIIVGRGTVAADDPALTARPPGPRVATRIVLDSLAAIDLQSQLVRTARETPVMIVTSTAAPIGKCDQLRSAGCELLALSGDSPVARLEQLLDELGRRRMTNVLVEGGASVLGSCFDAAAVDEVHVFCAPKLIGGRTASSPIGGRGIEKMADAVSFDNVVTKIIGDDVYLAGRIK